MVALSIALAYVASLAFVAFVMHQRKASRDVLLRVKALEVASEKTLDAVAATETLGIQVKLEVESLAERVGKLEMALQVKRVSLG